MRANENLPPTVEHAVRQAPATAPRPRWYETVARYVLAAIFLFGAVDGALFLFGGIYMHGRPGRQTFLYALQSATYFWAFLKLIQFVGAMSLLTNYKPVLGVALLIPISSVLCLFYLFELRSFIPFGSIIVIATLILCRAYARSYAHLLDDYPWFTPRQAPTRPSAGADRPAYDAST